MYPYPDWVFLNVFTIVPAEFLMSICVTPILVIVPVPVISNEIFTPPFPVLDEYALQEKIKLLARLALAKAIGVRQNDTINIIESVRKTVFSLVLVLIN